MRTSLAVAVLSAFMVACADGDVASPSALPSSSASAFPTHEPLGGLPDGCEPGPDPVSVSDHVGEGIGGDPAWAIGFGGPEATLSFNPDDPYQDHGWLRKVLWLLRRTTVDPVTVTGARVDDGSRLWFDYGVPGGQETTLVLDSSTPDGQQGDWFEYRGYFVVPSAGCYHLNAAWPNGGWELNFRAGLDLTQV